MSHRALLILNLGIVLAGIIGVALLVDEVRFVILLPAVAVVSFALNRWFRTLHRRVDRQ